MIPNPNQFPVISLSEIHYLTFAQAFGQVGQFWVNLLRFCIMHSAKNSFLMIDFNYFLFFLNDHELIMIQSTIVQTNRNIICSITRYDTNEYRYTIFVYQFCCCLSGFFHLLELLIDRLPPGDVLKWTQGIVRQAHWEKYYSQNRLRIGHRIDIIIDDPIQRSADVHVTWSLMSIWSNRHFGHWLSDLYTAGHMCF